MVFAVKPQRSVPAKEQQHQHDMFTVCVYVQHTTLLMDPLRFSEYFDYIIIMIFIQFMPERTRELQLLRLRLCHCNNLKPSFSNGLFRRRDKQ